MICLKPWVKKPTLRSPFLLAWRCRAAATGSEELPEGLPAPTASTRGLYRARVSRNSPSIRGDQANDTKQTLNFALLPIQSGRVGASSAAPDLARTSHPPPTSPEACIFIENPRQNIKRTSKNIKKRWSDLIPGHVGHLFQCHRAVWQYAARLHSRLHSIYDAGGRPPHQNLHRFRFIQGT